MAEYIEREALLADIDAAMEKAGMGYVIGQTMKRYIKRQPAADVVEVCRGIDCRCWQANNGGYPHKECRWGKDETPDADDFAVTENGGLNDGTETV